MSKHVFILGAGFSAPLGGPLFTQLLAGDRPAIRIPMELERSVKAIFESRLLSQQGKPLNAEELLDQLDIAERNPAFRSTDRILNLLGNSLPEHSRQGFLSKLNHFLKSLVAWQCEDYLRELEADSEKLLPYLDWARNTQSTDTIITFNYDTAVEKIFRLAGRPLPSGPGQYASHLPELLKLHGSVDWHHCPETGKIVQKPDAFTDDGLRLALGTPGRSKASLKEAEAPFKGLWIAAENAIREADIVSIIGYSMPATDNIARMTILNALAGKKNPNIRVNLILGPDSNSPRANRMVAITQPVVGGTRRVYDLPMATQDYIGRVADYATYDFV